MMLRVAPRRIFRFQIVNGVGLLLYANDVIILHACSVNAPIVLIVAVVRMAVEGVACCARMETTMRVTQVHGICELAVRRIWRDLAVSIEIPLFLYYRHLPHG